MLVFSGVFAGGLVACDTEFDPYASGPPYFAIDAQIDARKDTQFVRVQDLRIGPGAAPAPLPATVTLESGGMFVAQFRDSLVALEGGGTAHLFWTDAPLNLERGYQIVAVRDGDPNARSDGQFVFPNAAVFSDPRSANATQRSIRVNGITPRGVPAFVTYVGRRSDTGATATVRVQYSFVDLAGGQALPINLANDAGRIRDALDLPSSDTTLGELLDASVSYTAVSPDPAPILDGVGELTWIVDLVGDWMVSTAVLERVGLGNAQ